MPIRILTDPACVIGYKSEIVALADSDTSALGFLPQGMFEPQINKGAVFVAVDEKRGKTSFGGYILLGGKYPARRVFQIAVKPKYRKRGVGKKLLKAAEEAAKEAGFSSICAKVGSGLRLANKFWESQGFVNIEKQAGGSMHPVCYIREKRLAPSLLDGYIAERNMQMALVRAIETPRADSLLVVDTNVYIDAANKEPYADFVFQLEERGQIQIARTPFITQELRSRKSKNGVIKLAEKFPESKAPCDSAVVEQLRKMIFGSKALNPPDKADLHSLATAIAESADYVTRDKEISRRSKELRDKFQLNIWSPEDLWDWEIHPGRAGKRIVAAPESANILQIDDKPALDELENNGFGGATVNKFHWHAALMRGKDMLGVVAAEKSASRHQNISLFLKDSDIPEQAAEILLGLFREQVSAANIELTLNSARGAGETGILAHGYIKTAPNTYWKTHSPRIVTRHNWADYRDTLAQLSGIRLPENPPNYARHNQAIPIGQKARMPMNELENHLSSVFILPERDGVVIPIMPKFADRFFNHKKQRPLPVLPSAVAALLARKSYLCHKSAASRIRTGMPVLFYQSKENSAIIAVARIVRTQLIDTVNMAASVERRLALSDVDIRNMRPPVLEIMFDNVAILPNPVSVSKLKQINCYHKAGFVTATAMDASRVYKIIKEGLRA